MRIEKSYYFQQIYPSTRMTYQELYIMSFQQLIIVGNVGKDAELSYTPQGIAVAKFSVAVSKVTGRGENKQEKTTWFRVTIWRERAENLSQYIKKGKKLMVIGEVDASAYTNKDGQPTASLELTANDIRFLDSRSEDGGGGSGNYSGNRSGNNTEYEEVGDIPF
jgi:single-strand DNA-binding protein